MIAPSLPRRGGRRQTLPALLPKGAAREHESGMKDMGGNSGLMCRELTEIMPLSRDWGEN